MERNVGGSDRLARVAVGVVLLAAGVAGYAGAVPLAVGPLPQALTAVAAVVVAVGLLATAATQFCPVNRLLGVDSCTRS